MAYTSNLWRFFLAQSVPNENIINNRIHELTLARNRQFEINLLGAGSATFTYPLSHSYADDIRELETCIIVTRDVRGVWSGPVSQVEEDLANNSMTVSAVGWWEELDTRFVEPGQEDSLRFTTTATNSTTIAFALLNAANTQTDSTGTVRPTKIGAGRADVSQSRMREYKVNDQISQSIRDLATVENGFDYEINPISRRLDIYYPRKGTLRSDINLGYNWGPSNVSNVRISTDATAIRNRHKATTTYQTAIAEDRESIIRYGMRTELSSLGDTPDLVAGAYANGEVAYKEQPRKVLTVTMRPGSASPELFRDFEIGDTLYLSARGGRNPINKQPVRTFGASVSIDENGVATISNLKTSPDGT
jgi:hypothetical protein